MPVIDFIESAHPRKKRVPWQRTLATFNSILFLALQFIDTVALVGFQKNGQWSSCGLGRPGWGIVALLTSALWYVAVGVALKRSLDYENSESKLPGIRGIVLLTIPAAQAGFQHFPDTGDGRAYFNPGVFFTGWLLVIATLILRISSGPRLAALGMALWLPWAWYAQSARERPAIFAGVIGLVLQIVVFVLVARRLARRGD
jgi:hypothetical protein